MGIEDKYEYIYYTVINTNEWTPLTREVWFNDGFTWHEAINYVEHLLKTSQDDSVKKYRVEYAQYCDNLEFWRHKQIQHKKMPVFVKFHPEQQIKNEGEGDLFIIYEDDGVHYESASDDDDCRPDIDEGSVDGLAGLGGRL